jgi:hypothetical protein
MLERAFAELYLAYIYKVSFASSRSRPTNAVISKCDLVRLIEGGALPHQIGNIHFGEVALRWPRYRTLATLTGI